jgi:uncharacterized integral membrane protein
VATPDDPTVGGPSRDDRPPDDGDAAGPERPGTPLTQQLGRAVVLLAAVLFGVFAVFNAQHVDFSWVFGETAVVEAGGERVSGGVRLIILLLVSFALGALVTWAVGGLRARRARRDRRDAPDEDR